MLLLGLEKSIIENGLKSAVIKMDYSMKNIQE